MALALGLIAGMSACGSRASDSDIAAALRLAAGLEPGETNRSGADGAATTDPGVRAPDTASAAGESAQTATGTTGASGTTGTTGAADPGTKVATGGAAKASGATSAGTARSDAAVIGGRVDKASAGAPSRQSPTVANKSVVKIGNLGLYSGVIGVVFEPAAKTLQTWAAWVNDRGGLNGHPVQVIVGDTGGDGAKMLTLARRMVEKDKIIAWTMNTDVFSWPQFVQYAEKVNIPLVGGIGTFETAFTSPISFPVASYVPDQVVAGLTSLARSGDKIAITYCIEASVVCEHIYKEAASSSELTPYKPEGVPVSLVAPSYTAQCLRMKSEGYNLVFMIMDTASAGRFVQNCASQGYKPKLVLVGLNATPAFPSIPSLAGVSIPGTTVAPVPGLLPAVDEYLKAMDGYAPEKLTGGYSLLGWASSKMLEKVGANLSDKPTSAELFTELFKVRGESLGGLTPGVSYAKGKGTTVKPCASIWDTKNGAWVAPNGAKFTCVATTTR